MITLLILSGLLLAGIVIVAVRGRGAGRKVGIVVLTALLVPLVGFGLGPMLFTSSPEDLVDVMLVTRADGTEALLLVGGTRSTGGGRHSTGSTHVYQLDLVELSQGERGAQHRYAIDSTQPVCTVAGGEIWCDESEGRVQYDSRTLEILSSEEPGSNALASVSLMGTGTSEEVSIDRGILYVQDHGGFSRLMLRPAGSRRSRGAAVDESHYSSAEFLDASNEDGPTQLPDGQGVVFTYNRTDTANREVERVFAGLSPDGTSRWSLYDEPGRVAACLQIGPELVAVVVAPSNDPAYVVAIDLNDGLVRWRVSL